MRNDDNVISYYSMVLLILRHNVVPRVLSALMFLCVCFFISSIIYAAIFK